MTLSRRSILKAAGVLPLAAGHFTLPAAAQTAPADVKAAEIPPILFVHGNGDHAALWMTTLWRMESNGVRARPDAGDQFHRPARANR